MYKKLREPINSITHLAGAGLSFIALIAMLAKVVIYLIQQLLPYYL